MTIDPNNTLFLFDYGGVIARHHQDPAERLLSNLLGVDRVKCRELLSERSDQGRAFREDRISEEQFWQRVHIMLGREMSSRVDISTLSRLWAETYNLDDDMLCLLEKIRTQSRVGILSNIDRARSEYLTTKVKIMDRVDAYFPSYQFKTIKPFDQIWTLVNAEVISKFGDNMEVIYFDDRQQHVDACAQVGWTGRLFQGLQSVSDELGLRGINT